MDDEISLPGKTQAEWDLWGEIQNRAKVLFPHYKDVIYTLTIWSCASFPPRSTGIKLREEPLVFFHSLADAERHIALIVKQRKTLREDHPYLSENESTPYCFLVNEVPVGVPRHLSHEAQAWWRYDGNGKLIVSSLVSEIEDERGCLEPFFGRPPEMCPARTGDIVEVMRGDKVTLGIVFSPPPSPAKMMKRLQRYHNEPRGAEPALSEDDNVRSFSSDYSDDSYIILDGTIVDGQDTYMCAHSHPEVKSVSPASRIVSTRVREKLEKCFERVKIELIRTRR